MNRKLKTQVLLEKAGQRLDVFLVGEFPEFSRSHVQRLLDGGAVEVNGRSLQKSAYRLEQGDQVTLLIPDLQQTIALPQQMDLDVLYEDGDVIVINKPRGLVVHPAPGHADGTLVNALLAHCSDLSGINGIIRPGIVHRLDKDTSGVMLAAKNDHAHVSLAAQIKQKTAARKYVALVHGRLREDKGTIDAPIGRHHSDRKKMAVEAKHGKSAVTHYSVLQRYARFSLVSCQLTTGRTHQIRVHMAFIGHPVAGDPKYGPKHQNFAIEGQALHSAEIEFIHPVNQKTLSFSAPIPDDMVQLIKSVEHERL